MRRLLLIPLMLLAALAGCGDSKGPPTTTRTGSAGFPVTVAGATIAARPGRIVSLSATATEMLYAVGAGHQVAAVDKYSTYPKNAPRQDSLSGFDSSAESIAKLNPDLVVLSDDNET